MQCISPSLERNAHSTGRVKPPSLPALRTHPRRRAGEFVSLEAQLKRACKMWIRLAFSLFVAIPPFLSVDCIAQREKANKKSTASGLEEEKLDEIHMEYLPLLESTWPFFYSQRCRGQQRSMSIRYTFGSRCKHYHLLPSFATYQRNFPSSGHHHHHHHQWGRGSSCLTRTFINVETFLFAFGGDHCRCLTS